MNDLAHIPYQDSSLEEKNPVSIPLSKYTKAVLKSWNTPPAKKSSSVVKISVSQTVSFAAFLYEKLRNAVEFREDHLIRRAAIERMIKRRLILNENGRNLSEVLIKELLWARYYENNSIGEDKIGEIQSIWGFQTPENYIERIAAKDGDLGEGKNLGNGR